MWSHLPFALGEIFPLHMKPSSCFTTLFENMTIIAQNACMANNNNFANWTLLAFPVGMHVNQVPNPPQLSLEVDSKDEAYFYILALSIQTSKPYFYNKGATKTTQD